jgi:hypothetical protein
MAYNINGSFEQESHRSDLANYRDSVTMGLVRDGTAKPGSAFLGARTITADGSVSDDFSGFASGKLGFFASLRAKPRGRAISGTMTLSQSSARRLGVSHR